jgi:hypothetical protein
MMGPAVGVETPPDGVSGVVAGRSVGVQPTTMLMISRMATSLIHNRSLLRYIVYCPF